MSNALYDHGREGFLTGALNWASDNIKVAVVNTSGSGSLYTVDLANHQHLSEIVSSGATPTSAIIARSGNLTTKTTTAGVADADDVTFSSLSGDSIEAVVIYKDTGTDSTSPLIAYIDTASSGLPLTPNGGDVTIAWSNGSSKVFKL